MSPIFGTTSLRKKVMCHGCRHWLFSRVLIVLTLFTTSPSFSQTRERPDRPWTEVVKMHFNPAISDGVFTAPNRIDVDVLTEVSPREVVLRSGATGTEVADSFLVIATTKKKTSGPRGFTRFSFMIATCERIAHRFEVVATGTKNQKYIVSSEPFECKGPGAQ